MIGKLLLVLAAFVACAFALAGLRGRLSARAWGLLVLSCPLGFSAVVLGSPALGHALRAERFLLAPVALALLALALRWPPLRARFDASGGLVQSRMALRLVLFLTVFGLPLALVETVCWGLMTLGQVKPYVAMMTAFRDDTDADWRRYHMIAEQSRLPDPLLFWRPAPRSPYNRHGYLGPDFEADKPAGVFRVLALGDSNTEGGGHRPWPDHLRDHLRPARGACEVINGGVAGYSSLQGLRRFREAQRYRPDVTLVSFGWNDVATTRGPRDLELKPPPMAWVAIERVLVRYAAYLTLKRLGQRSGNAAGAGELQHRVTEDEYLENLGALVQEGRAAGVAVVLLTRPHRERPEALRALADWQAQVPQYNEALRQRARREGWPLIDVQGHFLEHHPEKFVDSCHFSTSGNEEAGRFVAQELRSLGLWP